MIVGDLLDLKPFRGAYVDMTYEWRDTPANEMRHGCISLSSRPTKEWTPAARSGILGIQRNGHPKLDGESWFCAPFQQYRAFQITERFRVAKNAIRFLCRGCSDPRIPRCSPIAIALHPLAAALDRARVARNEKWGKSFICSACGRNGLGGGIAIPSELWWITTETSSEEIERRLAPAEFDRVMRDATLTVYLDSCSNRGRTVRISSMATFELTWTSTRGEYVRSGHEEPPPAGWWGRWLAVEELRPHALWIRMHDGHELYRRPPTAF
jgi:hypothetical protein